jgi:hypothetical protein
VLRKLAGVTVIIINCKGYTNTTRRVAHGAACEMVDAGSVNRACPTVFVIPYYRYFISNNGTFRICLPVVNPYSCNTIH